MQKLQWTDATGRAWSTRLDVPGAARLKAAGYDLRDHERLAVVLSDPYDAADFVVEYHRPQWQDTHQMTEAEFLELCVATEDSLELVLAATVAGLIDFFRRFGDALRAGVVAKARDAAKLGTAALDAKLASPKVDQAIAAELRRREAAVDAELEAVISGGGFGESSASSESTLAALPYGNWSGCSTPDAGPPGTIPRPYSPKTPASLSTLTGSTRTANGSAGADGTN